MRAVTVGVMEGIGIVGDHGDAALRDPVRKPDMLLKEAGIHDGNLDLRECLFFCKEPFAECICADLADSGIFLCIRNCGNCHICMINLIRLNLRNAAVGLELLISFIGFCR